jgi:peptidoglycan/xylan/chitin deacetylase (PgdA/CDA1 family)
MSCDTAAIRSSQGRRGGGPESGSRLAHPVWISVGWVFLTIVLQSCAAGPRLPEALDGPLVIAWGRATISYHGSVESGGWTSISTRGDGRPTFVRSRNGDASLVDLDQYFLRCRVRIDRTDRVVGLELRLSDTTTFERHVAFRIPFFSDPSADRIHPGEWTRVSFGLGEAVIVGDPDPDHLAYFGWFVMDNGEGKAVFDLTELERVPRPQEGIVSFTFDDGYLDQLEGARALSEYGMAATAYVMPRQVGAPGYLDSTQLAALVEEHGWEISSHHATPFTDLSRQDLEDEVAYSFELLERLGFASSAGHLAYPLGKQNSPVVMDVVRNAFTSARLATGGLETLPPADWHLLRAVNVLPTLRPREVLATVQRAHENGDWAILMFHHLVEAPRQDTDYTIADFEELVRLVAESGARVMTVGQVWSLYGTPADGVAQVRSAGGDQH